jgi:alanine racemase
VGGSMLAEVRIDVAAIRDNARLLAARTEGRELLADVSCDGYGHGVVPSATAALEGGATWLGVDSLTDADLLRRAGIRAPVLALQPLEGTGADEVGVEVGERPELVRSDIGLYGLGVDSRLRAAMRVSVSVVGTKSIGAGEGVSYGYLFRASRRTNLALLSIGYANGVDRVASNVGGIMLAGRERRIAGRVAMNALVLDLGDDTASVGDEATVFGGDRRAQHWAESIGRRADEVAIGFGQNLPRSWS